MDSHANLKVFPGSIGRVDGRVQRDSKGQTGSVVVDWPRSLLLDRRVTSQGFSR